jgi:hypothetical protein
MVEVPPISTDAGFEETVMVGAAIVTVALPDTPLTVAVTVTLPSLRAVNVALATPLVVWPLLTAVMEPREESLTVKVTTVLSATKVPSVFLTVANMEEVCVRLMVAGEAKTVTEPISAMVTVVVPVAVPTVAVIVSLPTALAVNVTLAIPLALLEAVAVILPIDVSLNEKSTEIPLPKALPA